MDGQQVDGALVTRRVCVLTIRPVFKAVLVSSVPHTCDVCSTYVQEAPAFLAAPPLTLSRTTAVHHHVTCIFCLCLDMCR